MTRAPHSIGASVRARLLRLARERGEDFQLVLLRYANERWLYRLAQSEHASRFVLKGAALFTLWAGAPHRATRDLDLLGSGDSSEEEIRRIFAEVITLEVPEDGVVFDAESLVVGPIREAQAYGGLRAQLGAQLTSARVKLQIDVGFGDAVTPEAPWMDFPVLLDAPAPRLRMYPRETVVAEKLEALVQLGLLNSRMKDFYDLAVLAREFDFDGGVLVEAIRATFARRRTPLPSDLPVALTSAFTDDPLKNEQWAGFARKSRVKGVGELAAVVGRVASFAGPALVRASERKLWSARWRSGGPWFE